MIWGDRWARATGLSVPTQSWVSSSKIGCGGLVTDYDGTALIVAKTIGSLMIEDGPRSWFKLRRISSLTGQSPEVVAGILYRLRGRGRLHFERRDDHQDGVNPAYRFAIPAAMPELIERAGVWSNTEVRKR
jgi:hypothetical protein